MVKTKSVFSAIEPTKAGLRILATRFRGRGLPASRYHVWMANLGPSEGLLRAVLADEITWSEFSRRYRKELFEGGTIDRRNRLIKNHGQKFTLRHDRHEGFQPDWRHKARGTPPAVRPQQWLGPVPHHLHRRRPHDFLGARAIAGQREGQTISKVDLRQFDGVLGCLLARRHAG